MKKMTKITSASVGQSAFLSHDPIFCCVYATYGNVDANQSCYLQNNNLSGAIPAALLLRKQASVLIFEYSGNSLCESSTADCVQPSPGSSAYKKSSTGAIVGGAVGGILVVAIVIGIAVYCCCFTKKPPVQKDATVGGVIPQASPKRELQINEINDNLSPGIPVLNKAIPKLAVQEFSYEEIQIATNNFKTKLGQGGFGSVYKGCLQDGCFVAVKVASNAANQGTKEFLNEVDLLSRVHHKSLVGLLGFCNEQKAGTGQCAAASPLSWRTRLRIMVDAAQGPCLGCMLVVPVAQFFPIRHEIWNAGFDYLHNGCNPRIIHRDIKSSNILLNDTLEAKISDFGISRDYIWSETGPLPTTLMGSVGYMDPEYMSNMKLTEKVDIYSFGVLLFEVISGQTAIFKDSSQQPTNLVEWAKASIDRRVIDEIVDVSLHGQYDDRSAWKVAEVALACVECTSSRRPKMSEVHLELKEAERMELESEEINAIDQPSVEFTGNSNCSTLPYTHVRAR
ncbi:hypothetical protein L7F22_037179 [Adiantum nelumboides]|nr:hypothetical protein [Adiantum nelumboides]